MVSAVIVAAGSGSRMQSNIPKPFLPLGKHIVLAYALQALQVAPEIDEIIVVTRPEFLETVTDLKAKYELSKLVPPVPGGATRLASVRIGIRTCSPNTGLILVHDAARPCLTQELIRDCLASARRFGSGVAAARAVDSLKSATDDGFVKASIDRSSVWIVQTPQVFQADLLRSAIGNVSDSDPAITDEASIAQVCGIPVRLVENRLPNPKLTTPGDLPLLSALLFHTDLYSPVSGNPNPKADS